MRKVISSQLLLYCNLRLPFRARGSSKLDSIMALFLDFFCQLLYGFRKQVFYYTPLQLIWKWMQSTQVTFLVTVQHSVAESLELVEHPPHVYWWWLSPIQSSVNKSRRSPLVQRNGPKVSTNTTLSTKGNIVWTVTAACHFLRLFSPHHFHPETAHLTVVAFNRENETFTESTEMYVNFRMQRTKWVSI